MKCYPRFSHTRESRNCVRTSTKVLATLLITNQFFWLLEDSSINLQRLKNENQFETLVLYPGCKRVSCGVSAFGQVFAETQAKHWVPGVFFATWPLVASTFARPRNILPHARENPWYTGQGISFATTFKIHVTVFPVLFLCDLKLTLRLLVEIYLPFRYLRKQHKCCNLQHSLCFMSLWLFCYTSFEGIVNFWYDRSSPCDYSLQSHLKATSYDQHRENSFQSGLNLE